jgi:hypothetical protein
MASLRLLSVLLLVSLTACGEPAEDEVPCSGVADLEVGWGEAFDAKDLGALFSVWGSCHDDIWVVGGQGGDDPVGVAVHFDGEAWTPALDFPASPVLHWVHGAGGNSWFVGDDGFLARRSGTSFEVVDVGVDLPLWGVNAIAADDVWAVGGDPSDAAAGGVILHYDGSEWEVTHIPQVLFKVWGTRTDNVYAIGVGGVILRWDGTEWTPQDSGTTEDLISLWGRGDDDIVAIGGRGVGVGVRWDGASWTPFELLTPGMSGSWMDADGVVTAAGSRGTVATIEGTDVTVEDSGTMHLLHGVFGFDGGPRVAVGGSLTRQPPWEGVVLIDP